jgi:hypothetical protein
VNAAVKPAETPPQFRVTLDDRGGIPTHGGKLVKPPVAAPKKKGTN